MSPSEGHGLPWKELLIPQILNFSIFVFALIFLIKKPLKNYFSGKNEEFEEQRKKAEEYRVNAERQNIEVRNQMKVLEETASTSIENAKIDSTEIKEKIISEAQIAAKKITDETHKMAEFELARAIATLKEELVINATKMAEVNMISDATEKVQDRLNDDFISKAQVARR